jgi:hypothetical protein
VPTNTYDIYIAEKNGMDAKTAYDTIVYPKRRLVYPYAFLWPLAIGSLSGAVNKQGFVPENYTYWVNW